MIDGLIRSIGSICRLCDRLALTISHQPHPTINPQAIVTPYPQQASTAPATTAIQIPYDHLVLCTGSGYPSPIKAPVPSALGGSGGGHGGGGEPLSRAHRLEVGRWSRMGVCVCTLHRPSIRSFRRPKNTTLDPHIKQVLTTEAHKVEQARNVLILGGGTVGVELAAEIAWRYPRRRQQKGKQVCRWVGGGGLVLIYVCGVPARSIQHTSIYVPVTNTIQSIHPYTNTQKNRSSSSAAPHSCSRRFPRPAAKRRCGGCRYARTALSVA